LGTLVSLAKHFIDLDPNHFTSISSFVDRNTARGIATFFIRHLSETPYTGRYQPFWDERPVTLEGALVNLFNMFSSLYLLDPTIIRELHAVATRSANIQRRLGQWTIPNNTYLWTTTLTQVSDVFMAAGSSYMKPIDFVLKLQTIPDFIHEPAAKAHLQMITLEAYKDSLSLSSSGIHRLHSPEAFPQDKDCNRSIGQEESGDSDGDRDDADDRDGRRRLKRRPLRIRVRSVRTRHR
jgi:hypothetical protein